MQNNQIAKNDDLNAVKFNPSPRLKKGVQNASPSTLSPSGSIYHLEPYLPIVGSERPNEGLRSKEDLNSPDRPRQKMRTMDNEQQTTNYRFYTNRNVKVLREKRRKSTVMNSQQTTHESSDCGNTFTSFKKLPL
jgi:hypothetical protein